MTTDRRRRRRSTWLAFLAGAVAIAASAVLGLVGVRTLADSTAGHDAGARRLALVQELPYTPTALMGVLDDAGRLTSVVNLVLEPDQAGGTIVQVAVTADAASGTTDRLRPLGAVLAADGPEPFRSATSGMTALSYDVVELVDATRLRRLITPLGDLAAELPTDLHDSSTGDSWTAGTTELTSAAATRLLTASDPELPDWLYEADRAAVWAAIADAAGAGVTPGTSLPALEDGRAPSSLDEFVIRLFSGRVDFRVPGFSEISAERVDEQVPDDLAEAWGESVAVVAHDRAQMIMVLASIAPGRMGAPLDAPTFRIVSAFGADELGDTELSPSGVVKRAIDLLLFVQVNVVSVSLEPGEEVPEVTRIRVADPSVIDAVQATYRPIFGEIDVSTADVLIEGVEIEVTLGRSFLDVLRGEADDVAVSEGDADESDASEQMG